MNKTSFINLLLKIGFFEVKKGNGGQDFSQTITDGEGYLIQTSNVFRKDNWEVLIVEDLQPKEQAITWQLSFYRNDANRQMVKNTVYGGGNCVLNTEDGSIVMPAFRTELEFLILFRVFNPLLQHDEQYKDWIEEATFELN